MTRQEYKESFEKFKKEQPDWNLGKFTGQQLEDWIDAHFQKVLREEWKRGMMEAAVIVRTEEMHRAGMSRMEPMETDLTRLILSTVEKKPN